MSAAGQDRVGPWIRDLAWWKWALLALPPVLTVLALILASPSTGLLLFAGLWIGIARLIGFPPIVAASRPVEDFLVQIRPLMLPLLIVAIAGTVAFAWYVPLLFVPLLLAAGWYLLIVPERERTEQALRDTAAWMRSAGDVHHIAVGVLSAIGIALMVFVWFELRPDVSEFERRPEFSSELITAALVTWILAVVLRVGGFMTSWWRVAAGAITLFTVVRLLMASGLIPGNSWLVDRAEEGWLGRTIEGSDTWLLATAIALGVVALVDIAANLWPRLRKEPERGAFGFGFARTLTGLGLFTTVIATLILGVAAVQSVISYTSGGKEGITPTEEVISGKEVEAVTPQSLDPRALAETYMPVLAFTENERWRPVNVNSYIYNRNGHAATLIRPSGKEVTPPPSPLPLKCPGLKVPCNQITIECEEAEQDCSEGHPEWTDQGDAVPDYRDGTVYVRILTEDDPSGSSSAFRGIGFFKDRVKTLIQYWYFYRYNEWTRPVLGGRIVQRHEGDWEAVTIGFSETDPLFVAYSSHCGGSWQKWKQVELADTSPPVQPLIAVAEGSHANYIRTKDRRAPDWAACAGVPEGTTTLLSFASNIRDETEDGWTWLPSEGHGGIVYVNTPRNPAKFPMNLPWTWGGNDHTKLINNRHQLLGEEGRGPKTPSLQPLWYEPMDTIFCSRHWSGPERCTGKRRAGEERQERRAVKE